MPTRLVSQEEIAHITLLPFGKKHPVRLMIEKLQPGEMLEISKVDFHWKNRTPACFCKEIAKATKARFEIYKYRSNTGWLVKRVQ